MNTKRIQLIPLLAIVVGGGLLIGATNLPVSWYEGLAKPSFTLPNWLFAPARAHRSLIMKFAFIAAETLAQLWHCFLTNIPAQ